MSLSESVKNNDFKFLREVSTEKAPILYVRLGQELLICKKENATSFFLRHKNRYTVLTVIFFVKIT